MAVLVVCVLLAAHGQIPPDPLLCSRCFLSETLHNRVTRSLVCVQSELRLSLHQLPLITTTNFLNIFNL